jgi:hypothetical protein
MQIGRYLHGREWTRGVGARSVGANGRRVNINRFSNLSRRANVAVARYRNCSRNNASCQRGRTMTSEAADMRLAFEHEQRPARI